MGSPSINGKLPSVGMTTYLELGCPREVLLCNHAYHLEALIYIDIVANVSAHFLLYPFEKYTY